MTDDLADKLNELEGAWQLQNATGYAKKLKAMPEREVIGRMVNGMAILAGFEFMSERLAVALDSGDQEDEHSCFSDTTKQDFVYDLAGIKQVWTGDNEGGERAGLNDLVRSQDAALADRVDGLLADAETKVAGLGRPVGQGFGHPKGFTGAQGRRRGGGRPAGTGYRPQGCWQQAWRSGTYSHGIMPRTGVITATLLALASLAVLGSEAGVTPLREVLLAIPVTAQLGGDGTRPVFNDDAFVFQTPNSPKRHQRPFSFGNRLFNTNWVEAPGSVKAFDGLGPMFNRVSCSGCHTKDGRGRPPENNQGPMESMLLRISIPGKDANGGVMPHPVYGDQISERAILHVEPEARAEITYTERPGTYGDGEKFSLRQPHYAISDLKYGDLGKDIMISPRVAPP